MKCKSCNSEWNSSTVRTTCPFCGATLIDDSRRFANIEDAMAFIVNEYGVDIIKEKRKFISLLGDYAPDMGNERRLVKIAVDAGVYGELLDLKSADEAERSICIDKITAKLQHEYFLSIEWSKKVILWFVKCLNWSPSLPVHNSVPISSNNNSLSISNTGFDPAKYNLYSQDSDYIAAQMQERNENFEKAFTLYETAYKKGNILAGVKLALLYNSGNGTKVSKEKAYQLLSIAQKSGDPLAKAWISEYYRLGYAVPQNEKKATEILERCVADLEQMCACGDAEAQYFLGYAYFYGTTIEKNEDRAYNLLNKAYASGNISAGVILAECYIIGAGCPVDVKQGMKILEDCAKTTNIEAHFTLAKVYYEAKIDYMRAFSLFMFAAGRGHTQSQAYVGDCFYFGNGIEKDYDQAVAWYIKAVKQGDAYSARQLGTIYYNGYGVNADNDKSFYYFTFAADRGDTYSQYFLHFFYLVDREYQDYEKGLEYLFKAAEANNTDAQIVLGRLYLHGDCGLEQSDEKSAKWFLRAAELGNAEAERIVGEMYTHDVYFEHNSEESLKWLNRAIAHGDLQAHISIAELYMDGSLYINGLYNIKEYSSGDEHLSTCKEMLDNDKRYIQSGVLYKKIADMYYKYGKELTGDVKTKWLTKAVTIYQMLYLNGHEDALYDYAWGVFFDGVATKQCVDPIALVEKLKVHAENKGSARCALLLSKIYSSGYSSKIDKSLVVLESEGQGKLGIAVDKQEAEKWIKIAIQNGDMSAACSFSIELSKNPERVHEAFEYAKIAHERGNYLGTLLLGKYYKRGIGVKKDKSKARDLLAIARANGYYE